MRILFSMRHLGSLRMYESVIRKLATSGHEVRILANRRDDIGSGVNPETLLADVPHQWIWAEIHQSAWSDLAAVVGIWLDYLRYLDPRYTPTPRPRMRVGEWVPSLLRRVSGWPLVRANAGRRALVAVLRAAERSIPRRPEIDKLMHEYQPELVVVTPMLDLGSRQVEVLRSARAFGARTVLSIGGWDHLSNKGRISELPTRLLVWNDTQVGEATELHGVPPERIVVTGAQCYDQWFGRVPSRTREQFCSMLRLPVDRPFLLYACSALYPHDQPETEARFVRRWIGQIRGSDDPRLRSAAILVRPHPLRLEEWKGIDLSDLPDVTVHGALPIDDSSKEDYFDSLYYSAAVVGLNTSAFVEGGIVGRPVHTVVVPEWEERQVSPLHFVFLTTVGGGLLRLARGFDEHRVQLAASLREPVTADLNADFVRAFVRPLGLGHSATDAFIDAIDELGRSQAPAPARQPLWAPVVRLALRPAASVLQGVVARVDAPTDRTLIELKRLRQRIEYRREREAERQQRDAEREAERAEKVRRADTARQEEQRARQERIALSEREKRALKAARERHKRQHQRGKRRAVVMGQIKRRLGLGS
jgi:hypothetical protein